jgi:hypothetical protein
MFAGNAAAVVRDEASIDLSQLDGQSWSTVMDWISEQTGLPLVTGFKPSGKFTYTGPKGARYTVSKSIDILTRAMLLQNLLLIRREHYWILTTDLTLWSGLCPPIPPAPGPGKQRTAPTTARPSPGSLRRVVPVPPAADRFSSATSA